MISEDFMRKIPFELFSSAKEVPAFPALPPGLGFIKYPPGSQPPEARADCRKVIQITRSLSAKDRQGSGNTGPVSSSSLLPAVRSPGGQGSSRALDGIHCWGHRRSGDFTKG
ncbi:hypothetical protein IHE44_0013685 [Lamprotornis superbus]|uniref:Uncharacterized protein n=1 Tax=Lamprotornis superbus TaxID=245042 RepID=A0A835NZF3_9PASS|nr:hypothetical protein IHE44_0013685 [Lamprotornis superbus]